MSPRNIIVLGGGFSGLRAARDLARGLRRMRLLNLYNVVLIDRNSAHTFTPLLYSIVTATDAIALKLQPLASIPFADIIHGSGIKFVQGEVVGIDVNERTIRLSDRSFEYDYMLFGLGSEPASFSIPGLREHAFVLKTVQDAIRIRDAVLDRWKRQADDIDIVVIGGGPTSVGLAAELRTWTDSMRTQRIRPPEVHIRLVERMRGILETFDARLVDAVTSRLRILDIEVRTDATVTSASAGFVTLANGESVRADICIWMGGVRGFHLADSLPFPRDASGRVSVDGGLRGVPAESPFAERIYVMGDAAGFHEARHAPKIAPVAIRQGAVAARNVLASVARDAGRERAVRRVQYRPHGYPFILTLGGAYVVVSAGPVVVAGPIAWFFKRLVELYYLLSILPPHRAAAIWFKVFHK